jgi:hypothetical protein
MLQHRLDLPISSQEALQQFVAPPRMLSGRDLFSSHDPWILFVDASASEHFPQPTPFEVDWVL